MQREHSGSLPFVLTTGLDIAETKDVHAIMTSTTFVRALAAAELVDGAKRAVELDGASILLCRTGGRLFAVSNVCSHADERLECGRMGNGWIACPVHGARFDLASGKAKNPPAKRPIATYAVRESDGWIEVSV